ncbi:adhesin family protein [Acetobacter malorum]|uniref:Adhesin family protein n=1 Tax=Acetobacter malorum TaxID=178901 RepID=A0A177G7R4_9PROT|nr:Hint domain-containing protein [Acetobacter malorum]OAG75627.1 adhesin family protein [Acetobacter malorum]
MATYNITSGQVVSNPLVYGDVETVSSGGATQDQTNNGQRYVLSGGIVRNGVVGSSGKDYIYGGASSFQGVIQSGGIRFLSDGATADNPFIANGGTVSAASGATVLNAYAFSSGVLSAASGAIVSGGTLETGGSITANSGTLLEGTINVSSGSTVTNGTLTGLGANLKASAGGLVSGVSVESGGILSVSSGGYASNTTVLNGGSLRTQGTLSNTTISSGGSIEFMSGGQTTYTYILAGAHVTVDSGATFNQGAMAVSSMGAGGTVEVQSGGILQNQVLASGASAYLSSGAVISGTLTVTSGASATLNGTAGSGSVSLSGDGAHLVISGTTMPTNTISGWSPTDTIELASIPAASVTSVTTTSTGITFYTANGNYALNVPGASTYGYNLSSDSNGGLIYTTCFAEGTLIMTPDGEATVETLVPGTLVMTPKGAMPVKWLGHRSITVSSQPVPEENWLVRIREGALADGVPSRDLLVTQEHCMVFEGKLVPARMLVNDASILIDRTINSYTYYHVELESHEAIWAENALTESYLDTGNRNQFDNHTVTAIFGGSSKAGGSETLPLETSRAFVEPIYAAIAARAGSATHQPELTNDPDLHLVTNSGQVIRPLRQVNDRIMFMIPANVATVSLVSRASRPSDTIGPFVDDRRDLGVVGNISLFANGQTVNLTTHLSQADLAGWHGLESSQHRWTDGNASLPLQTGSSFGKEPAVLSIQVISSGSYLVGAPVHHGDLRHAG